MDKKKPGLLCRMGQNDLLAGLSRLLGLSTPLLGALLGSLVLWWVHDLGTKLDNIHDEIATLFRTVNTVQVSAAASDVKVQDLQNSTAQVVSEQQDHDRRITRLEAKVNITVP